MSTRYSNITVQGDGSIIGDRLWTGDQINSTWNLFNYNSDNRALWGLDANGWLQYKSQFSTFSGRYNQYDLTLGDTYFTTNIIPAGTGNYEVGFFMRFVDHNTFYYLSMNGGYQDWGGKNIRLYKVSGPTVQVVADYACPVFNTATTYSFRCDLVANTVTITLNGTQIINWTDTSPSPYTKGAFGPYVMGQIYAKWDGFHAKSSTAFTVVDTENNQAVTPQYGDAESALLMSPKSAAELVQTALNAYLATATYDSYTMSDYRLSSSNTNVVALFDQVNGKTTTTDGGSKVYLYQPVPTTPPLAPTNFIGQATDPNTINYTWSLVDTTADGYIILDGNDNTIATLGEGVTTYTEKNLTEGTSYVRTVVAYNRAGRSAPSNQITVLTPQTLPAAPISLAVDSLMDVSATYSWVDESFNENTFELIAVNSDGTQVVLAEIPANTTTYTETGLTPLTSYSRELRAKNTAGYSDPTNQITFTTKKQLPKPPTAQPYNFYGIGVADTEIFWYFEYPYTDADGFQLLDKEGNIVATIPIGSTQFLEQNLYPANLYVRQIRAYNEGGVGPATLFGSASTLTTGQDYLGHPVAPVNLVGHETSSTTAHLEWAYTDDPHMPALGFKLYNSDKTFFMAIPSDLRQFDLSNLTSDKTYQFYLTAYNVQGDSLATNLVTIVTPKDGQQDGQDTGNNTPTVVEDPLADITFDEETEDIGKIVAFQSGVGDHLDLKVNGAVVSPTSEMFDYTMQVTGTYEVEEEFYPELDFRWRIHVEGTNADGTAYKVDNDWHNASVNGGPTPTQFKSSVGVQVPSDVWNPQYFVQIQYKNVADDGTITWTDVPMYDPSVASLTPVNWTLNKSPDQPPPPPPPSPVTPGGNGTPPYTDYTMNSKDVFEQWLPIQTGVFTSNIGYSNGDMFDYSASLGTYYKVELAMGGRYSTQSYDDYEMTTTLHNFETVDHVINGGIVIARVLDPSKSFAHLLLAYRQSNRGTGYPSTFSIVYTTTALSYDKNYRWTVYDNHQSYGDDAIDVNVYEPVGSTLKVKRQGNIVQAWASPFGSTILESAAITVDMSQHPELAIFQGPQPFGIAGIEQGAFYTDFAFKIGQGQPGLIGATEDDTPPAPPPIPTLPPSLPNQTWNPNDEFVVWGDKKDVRYHEESWQGAVILSNEMTVQAGDILRFTDRIPNPCFEIPYQDISQQYTIKNFQFVLTSSNMNVELVLDTEIDFSQYLDPSLQDPPLFIDLAFHAWIINETQTAWYPGIHAGYYYLNQQEHYLFVDDTVWPKDQQIDATYVYTFPYVIKASGKRHNIGKDLSFTDTTKEDFLKGTVGTGISLDLITDAVTLTSGTNTAVFISQVFNFGSTPATWDAITWTEDPDAKAKGATVQVEAGVSDDLGVVAAWTTQTNGQPLKMDGTGDKIRYRLTLTTADFKKDSLNDLHEDNSLLAQGVLDRISINGDAISIANLGTNMEGVFVTSVIDLGTQVDSLGQVVLDLNLPDTTSVQFFSATSDDPTVNFRYPTSATPWVPLAKVSQSGSTITFNVNSVQKRYMVLIFDLKASVQKASQTILFDPQHVDVTALSNIQLTPGGFKLADQTSSGVYAPAAINVPNLLSFDKVILTDANMYQGSGIIIETVTGTSLDDVNLKAQVPANWQQVQSGAVASPVNPWVKYRVTIFPGMTNLRTTTFAKQTYDDWSKQTSRTNIDIINDATQPYLTLHDPSQLGQYISDVQNLGFEDSINPIHLYSDHPEALTLFVKQQVGTTWQAEAQVPLTVANGQATGSVPQMNANALQYRIELTPIATVQANVKEYTLADLDTGYDVENPGIDYFTFSQYDMGSGKFVGQVQPDLTKADGVHNYMQYISPLFDSLGFTISEIAWTEANTNPSISVQAADCFITASDDPNQNWQSPSLGWISIGKAQSINPGDSIYTQINGKRYVKFKFGFHIAPGSSTGTYASTEVMDVQLSYSRSTYTSPKVYEATFSVEQYDPISPTLNSVEIDMTANQYFTPTVSNIHSQYMTYELVKVAPIVDDVTVGGGIPAGDTIESYSVPMSANLVADMNEHPVTDKTAAEIVDDWLTSQGIPNDNSLEFTDFTVATDAKYPVVLRTDQDGNSFVFAKTTAEVGDVVHEEVKMYFDLNTMDAVFSPIPQNGAPVVVRNAANNLLRQVHFRDNFNLPTLVNQETMVTTEQPILMLSYQDIDPLSLQVFIDINNDGNFKQIFNCDLAETHVVLPNYFQPGLPVVVNYVLKDSFFVDYNYDPLHDYARIAVHTSFDPKNTESARLYVSYETEKTTAYYTADEVDLNPLHTLISSGFMYLTDVVYPAYRIESYCNPNIILKNRDDRLTINARILDEYGNPVVGTKVDFTTSVGIIKTITRVSDQNGLVTAIFMSPQNTEETMAQVMIKVLDGSGLQQIVEIGLVEENFIGKLAIVPEKDMVKKGDVVLLKVIALGANDERVGNQSIVLSTTAGTISNSNILTNAEGEGFTSIQIVSQAPVSSEIITAGTTDSKSIPSQDFTTGFEVQIGKPSTDTMNSGYLLITAEASDSSGIIKEEIMLGIIE